MSGLRALRTCAAQLLCKSELSAEQITERALSSLGASASSQQLAVPSFWFGPSSHGAGSLPHLPQRAFASKAGGKDAGGGKGAGGKAGAASGKDAATQAAAPTALSVQLSDKPSAYPSLPLPPGIGALVPPSKPYELVPELPQRDVAFKAQYVPWTPTRQLQRRRKISKRMAFLVQVGKPALRKRGGVRTMALCGHLPPAVITGRVAQPPHLPPRTPPCADLHACTWLCHCPSWRPCHQPIGCHSTCGHLNQREGFRQLASIRR